MPPPLGTLLAIEVPISHLMHANTMPTGVVGEEAFVPSEAAPMPGEAAPEIGVSILATLPEKANAMPT